MSDDLRGRWPNEDVEITVWVRDDYVSCRWTATTERGDEPGADTYGNAGSYAEAVAAVDEIIGTPAPPVTSVPVPVWPDEATVERARAKVRAYLEQENSCSCIPAYKDRGMDDPQCAFHAVVYMDGDGDLARAALSVVPDPSGDAVLLAKVREQWAILNAAGWIDGEPSKIDALNNIAALLAGGEGSSDSTTGDV